MEHNIFRTGLFFLTTVLSIWSCKKNIDPNDVTYGATQNTPPFVYAGPDQQINLYYTDSTRLFGEAFDREDIFLPVRWTQVSGPPDVMIENKDQRLARLSNLKEGTYLFELFAEDKGKLASRDTVSIVAQIIIPPPIPPNPNELIFYDQIWDCPMGCYIKIANITSMIPANSRIEVFLKRDFSPVWLEVYNYSNSANRYSFQIYNQDLIIYDAWDDGDETPDIKVVY